MFLFGLTCGLLGEFILARIMDSLSHRSAMRIKYDCNKCAYKCNGYHCFKMRQELAESVIEDADTIEGGEYEVLDISGEGTD